MNTFREKRGQPLLHIQRFSMASRIPLYAADTTLENGQLQVRSGWRYCAERDPVCCRPDRCFTLACATSMNCWHRQAKTIRPRLYAISDTGGSSFTKDRFIRRLFDAQRMAARKSKPAINCRSCDLAVGLRRISILSPIFMMGLNLPNVVSSL